MPQERRKSRKKGAVMAHKAHERTQKGSETAQRGRNGYIRGQGGMTMPEPRGVSTRNAPDLPEGFKTPELGLLPEEWQEARDYRPQGGY